MDHSYTQRCGLFAQTALKGICHKEYMISLTWSLKSTRLTLVLETKRATAAHSHGGVWAAQATAAKVYFLIQACLCSNI